MYESLRGEIAADEQRPRRRAEPPPPLTDPRHTAALDLQRGAGNQAATAVLARAMHHGARKVPSDKLGVIKAKLLADLGPHFPEKAWREACRSSEAVQLEDWLAEQDLGMHSATDLMRHAREELNAKAPPRAEPTPLTGGFFDPFRSRGKYGVPAAFDPELIDESSDSESEWPKTPKGRSDKGRTRWEPSAFLTAFSEHVAGIQASYKSDVAKEGGQRAYELDATTPGARRLMDLAWVLEKLDPKRVCVATMFSDGTLRLYANTMDDALVTDAQLVAQAATEDMNGAHPILDGLTQRIVGHTGPRLGAGRREPKAKLDARWQKASRRVFKAGQELAHLKGRPETHDLEYAAHKPRQAHKHAEMRLLDAAHAGAKGDVGISKICCAKCYCAIVAAREINVDLNVQGAHFASYETSTGWPMPHFLKSNEKAMKAFLGPEGFAWYHAFPADVIAAVEGRKLREVKGLNRLDPYSSDEDEPKRGRKRGRDSQDAEPPSKKRRPDPVPV
jgi:hypothetical protein